MKFIVRLSVLAAAAMLAAHAPAKEYKMTIGSSHPPVLPWTIPLPKLIVAEANKRLKAAGSPDTIKWTEAYAGALYDFNNTLEGVGDGLADIGWVGSLWEPAKQPLQNVAYYSPFVTGDFRALVDVQNELMAKVPAFAAEWTKYNTVFLGAQVAEEGGEKILPAGGGKRRYAGEGEDQRCSGTPHAAWPPSFAQMDSGVQPLLWH